MAKLIFQVQNRRPNRTTTSIVNRYFPGGLHLVNKGLELVFKIKTLADDAVAWGKKVYKSKERRKRIYYTPI